MTATPRTLRLAHRGDWRDAPENTLAAFRAALADPGCDGLEFDVRLSADGVPVVCHDVTLARVQESPEPVDTLAAADLGTYDIPTLAEVLALAGRETFLDIECKTDPGPAFVGIVSDARGPDLARAVVSSFEPEILERVASQAGHWPLWLNTMTLDASIVAWAVAFGCRGVSVEWRALDRHSIGLATAAGLEVAAWTVRRRPTYDRLARLGVVAICVEGRALDGPRA